MDEITVIVRHNAFNTVDCDRQLIPYNQPLTLLDIRNQVVPSEVNVIVSINGQVIPDESLALCIPKSGDCIVMTPKLEYVAAAVAAWAAALTIASSLTISMITVIVYCLVYAVVFMAAVGLQIAAGMLISSLFAPDTPDVNTGGGMDASQIYSWSPTTTNKQGGMIPRMYGESRAVGNAIAVYTETVSDKSYLNILISLGMGPISQLSDFRLNDQNSEVFTGVNFEARYGHLNQALIPNFDDTKTEFATNRTVKYGTPIDYLTVNSSFDQLEVDITFPRGVYYMNDQGGLSYHSITYKIEAIDPDDTTKIIPLARTVVTQATESGIGHWSLGQWEYGASRGPFDEELNDYLWGYAWSEVGIGSSVYTDHIFGERGATQVMTTTGYYDGFGNYQSWSYPITVYGTWRWIKTEESYYTTIVDYVTYYNATNSPVTVTYKTSVPSKKQYLIRITKLSGDITSSRYGDQMVLSAVREVYNDDFTYPRHVLVGIKALATEQLSGSLGFSCLIKGALIRTYDGSSWKVEYSTNPAWVCYDILSQPIFNDPSCVVYGSTYYQCKLSHTSSALILPTNTTYWQAFPGPVDTATAWAGGVAYVDITDAGVARYDGINPTKLDYAAFKLWADFCDTLVNDGAGGTEKRFEFNGGFDAEFSLWEAAFRVCQMSRSALYWNGNQISVIIDQAATAVQLFSSGNIVVDSFEETFLPYEDRAAEIEISFMNQEMDYDRDTFTIFNTTLDNPTSKASLQLIGCTKPSQAWRSGEFLLLCNQYIKRAIKFNVGIDAIACTIGDVINFQHDVPRWGLAGGRVVSATESTVTLDTEVTIEAAKTYSIMIRLSTDVLVTKTVSNAPGSYTVLTVSTPFTSIPAQYDVYSFGEAATVTKPFRVQSIEKTADQLITLNCLEYDANVYSVDTGTPLLPTINYSAFTPISAVTNLTLTEASSFDESGNVKRDIIVKFNKPNNPLYKRAIIYYQTYTTTTIGPLIYAGITTESVFTISGVSPLVSYTVYVASESFSGILLSQKDWASSTITITSSSPSAPSLLDVRVSGLELFNQALDNAFVGKDCKFVWNPIMNVSQTDLGAGEETQGAGGSLPPVWFKDYEVKIYSTAGVLRRTEYVQNPEYTYTFEKNYEDTGTAVREFEIRVKARDSFFNVSSQDTRLAVTNAAPAALTDITVTAGLGTYTVEFTPASDPDIMGYKVYASQTSGFTPSSSTLVNEGSDTRVVVSPTKSGTWYVKVAAYDSFGDITLNYSAEFSVTVSNWVEYHDLELELMKMNFQYVSWAQFAIFDDFTDESKRFDPEPAVYQCSIYKNSLISGGSVADRVYGFTSKQYSDVTTIETGTATSVGLNFLTDTTKTWFTDECKNTTLVDSAANEFTVTGNTANTLTVSGTPAAGAYSLKTANPAYAVAFCTYLDSTNGGYGYVRMEVSFDGGGHYQTVLDTEAGIDILEGTFDIAYPGVDYLCRFTLTNDSNGNYPIVYKYLVCTDPSPWRW